MPIYEYRCEKCKKVFTLTLSMAEHDKGGIKCPHCQSPKVVQQFTTFYAKTSKKS
jgi:putative FmdB family regulatory protein